MTNTSRLGFDPSRDLVLERTIGISPELVWAAWTKPEHLLEWFVLAPWSMADCDVDLRPGGAFHTVMRSPEGEEFPSAGCYLEIVPNERLVWTSGLVPGFRPLPRSGGDDLPFTAVIALEPTSGGTECTATAIHRDEEDRVKHQEMGFHAGWGAALDQLVAHMTR